MPPRAASDLPIRPRAKKPSLRVADVLAWADAFKARHKRWPNMNDGRVDGTADCTWAGVDQALRVGNRGLPAGSSLAKLLLKCRGRKHWHLPPALTVPAILSWADAHRRKTGEWPTGHAGCADAPGGVTWVSIDLALQRGKRGLPGGSSLADLLAEHRGVRNRLSVPDLSEDGILSWADGHHAETGRWPKYTDGGIGDAPGETWGAADTALFKGHRGLPGGDSLAKLLARHRGVRNKSALPPLTPGDIRAWAAAYRGRTGHWPRVKSGAIPEAPGETWAGINQALTAGQRGLPGGSSLFRLLNGRAGHAGR